VAGERSVPRGTFFCMSLRNVGNAISEDFARARFDDRAVGDIEGCVAVKSDMGGTAGGKGVVSGLASLFSSFKISDESEAHAASTCTTGDPVRSEKIHLALSHGNTRYEICNMIAKGIRATHKAGMRTEESIDRVLGMIGPKFIGPRVVPVNLPRPRR